jgi:serine/threonine protein kinase
MVKELSTLFTLIKQSRSSKPSYDTPDQINDEKNAGKSGRDHIVDFYDAFSNLEDGSVALMIEYMDGGSLQDLVLQGGLKDEPTLARISEQALTGLKFLHDCNQLHRDLKPGKLILTCHEPQ